MKKNRDRYSPVVARTRDHICYRLESIHVVDVVDRLNKFLLGY